MDAGKRMGCRLVLTDRRLLEIGGVKDAVRFDEDAAVLTTEQGTLTVEGAELHVRVLDPEAGQVVLEGRVDSVYYENAEATPEKRSLFGKLFR